jgi:shikimate kinase
MRPSSLFTAFFMQDQPTSRESPSAASPSIVVLTGFMGSGKTTVGRALAELLRWEFVDLDEHIERQEGMTVREIFAARGEEEFRRIEHSVLRSLLAGVSSRMVLALGGGAIVRANNTELIRAKQPLIVFLETPVEEMVQRCGVGDVAGPENARPLASDRAAFQALYEQRLPHYRTAHLTITTQDKSIEEVAKELAEKLA